MTSMYVGDINEAGYLQSLDRQGFNHHKCLLECIANCIDAGAKNINFRIENDDCIKMIDDGKGMNRPQFCNMFSMQRENHSNDKSCGISGLGGKVALLILSGKREAIIHTYDGVTYLKATVPWDKIYKEGKYSNMIHIDPMDENEISSFKSCLPGTGTIIHFPYNESLEYVINDNFLTPSERRESGIDLPNLHDMASIIFGRFPVKMLYNHFEKPKITKIMKNV